MNLLLYILLILWFASVAKSVLFWLYLLQLKEYRLDRLIDHFQTEKGRRILLSPMLIGKILILLASLLVNNLLYVALIIYLFDGAVTIKNILGKNLRRPSLTSKSIPLIVVMLASELLAGAWSYFYLSHDALPTYLLGLDIIVPLAIFSLVIVLKPFNQLLRRKIINAAKSKRAGLKDLLVIGITGSYGKTSTKEFLYTILKDKFKVIRTPEHINTEIGIANFILTDLKPEHEIFICEIGAYVKGEVKDICDLVRPKIGVFVGANEQHLALFGTMKNLLRAEGGEELLETLPQKGLAIFNGNNQYAYELWKKAQVPKRITYVPNLVNIINPERRDVRAENIEVKPDKIKFHVVSTKNSKGADFMVNLLGRHNIENILLATAVAEELGMNLPEIARDAFKIDAMKGTMSIKKTNGINVINSTYSSNPTAVEAHLEYLKTWSKENVKKIVIMPCLIELGSASREVHERIGELLGKTVDLAIVTTRERFDDIERGAAKTTGDVGNRIIYLENPTEILHKIKIIISPGDVILLEGRLPVELVKSIENL